MILLAETHPVSLLILGLIFGILIYTISWMTYTTVVHLRSGGSWQDLFYPDPDSEEDQNETIR